MVKRETGVGWMRREEIAGWLEEMAGQLRTGTLMVDGQELEVPEEVGARLKSRSRDGSRRLRLDLEWEDTEQPPSGKSGKKKGKKAKKWATAREGVGEPRGGAEPPEPEKNGADNRKSDGKRGTVRDYESHVLVCKGGDCSKRGGKETKKALKSELRAEGMNGDVRVDSVECLGLCKQGPNVIVYPEGSWYLGLGERDVPEVVEEHLKNGEPVERLAAGRKPRKSGAKKVKT